jgi:hypothetical protein
MGVSEALGIPSVRDKVPSAAELLRRLGRLQNPEDFVNAVLREEK